jgi:ketosteroid isomerase-like protein
MNNVELARAGFEAFNRGDVEGVLALLHPEVEVHSEGEVGEEGTYHGHEGYLRWVGVWLEAWDEFRVEWDELEEVDDSNLLVHVTQYARGKGSGLEATQAATYLFTVRDGLASRVHIYADRERALAAARA